MTKLELMRLLEAYPDDLQLLVESPAGGFEKPTLYVTGVRPRTAREYTNAHDSEYVGSRPGEGAAGMLVLGTALGALFLPI